MSYQTELNNKEQLNKVLLKNKKLLEKEIPKLNTNEHNEIFNIIRNNSSKYSENSRGVYINLKFLDSITINKVLEFIEYTKKNKKIISEKNLSLKKNNKSKKINDPNKFKLEPENIHKELERLKDKNNDNFSFQSFLDKISVTNIKQFSQSDNKIVYPTLKNTKTKFGGVKARILKKCREVNKTYNDNIYINNQDNVSYDSNDEDSDNEDTQNLTDKNKINNIIKNLNNLDTKSYEDENEF